MSIDKKLPDLWISEGMGRHGTVSSGIRIIIFIESHGFRISNNFVISEEDLDKEIQKLMKGVK